MKKHIYFTGFMGAGKSRLGRELAARISWPFLDSDLVIEEREQKSVAEIFKIYGEQFFRDKEHQLLAEISKLSEPTIVALGGGMLKNEDNLKLAMESGLVIYIKSSPESILQRVNYSDKRPLLSGKSDQEKLNIIRKMIDERKDIYEKAPVILERDGYTLDELLTKIEEIIIEQIGDVDGNG